MCAAVAVNVRQAMLDERTRCRQSWHYIQVSTATSLSFCTLTVCIKIAKRINFYHVDGAQQLLLAVLFVRRYYSSSSVSSALLLIRSSYC
jgi:hypothetical protein